MNPLEKYRCKRCGYQGKQMTDIKQHYKKKTLCEAIYCDHSYEYLLNKLAIGEHGNPIGEIDKYSLGNTITDPYGKAFTIQEIYTLPSFEQENDLHEHVNQAIEDLKLRKSYLELNQEVNVIITEDFRLLLLRAI